jgi:hypothetical protein
MTAPLSLASPSSGGSIAQRATDVVADGNPVRPRRIPPPPAPPPGPGVPVSTGGGTLGSMTDVVEEAAPRAHARIVFLGPVAPHWEIYGDWGDRQTLDEFRARALARLVLLPRDDPQFRRNKERINRDAERELISIEWELGLPDDAVDGD